MSHFTKIADGIDVAPVLAELDAQPGLWNTYPYRRMGTSPHRETDDMWIRYRDPDAPASADDFLRPHRSVFYPAWYALPSLHPIAYAMQERVGSDDMGGILMTRIPPGGQVYPHHDRGSWHAEHYNTKLWIPLRANPGCINYVEGEPSVWRPGEAWTHDNLLVHSVENHGDTERICLILCFRTDAPR